jgi:hypothetical protein
MISPFKSIFNPVFSAPGRECVVEEQDKPESQSECGCDLAGNQSLVAYPLSIHSLFYYAE